MLKDDRRHQAIRLIGQTVGFLEVDTINTVLKSYDELKAANLLDQKVGKNNLIAFLVARLQTAIDGCGFFQASKRKIIELKKVEIEALADLPDLNFYEHFKFQEYDIEWFEQGQTFWDLITQQPNIFIF